MNGSFGTDSIVWVAPDGLVCLKASFVCLLFGSRHSVDEVLKTELIGGIDETEMNKQVSTI